MSTTQLLPPKYGERLKVMLEMRRKVNIFVNFNGYDPLRMNIHRNTLVKTVLNACRNFFTLPLEDQYVLIFDGDRLRQAYLPDDLVDNDRLDLRKELRGC
jgi:hypothetical protein